MASAEPKLTEKKKDEDGFGRTEDYRETKDEDGFGKTEANGNRKKKNEDKDLCLRFARDYR
ncbi:MAG: hypothetical protein IIT55_09045 [Bacteroidaceae bacterium]|nr:hypothetical protein [Bacteroidaceae bacterium]